MEQCEISGVIEGRNRADLYTFILLLLLFLLLLLLLLLLLSSSLARNMSVFFLWPLDSV